MEENKLLDELLELSLNKETPYSPNQLKKMKEDRLKEVMEKYKERELDKMNEELVDVTFVKFEDILKRVSLIKESSDLGDKLKDRKLLRKDVKNLIASVTPFLPYCGLLEGVLVTTGEVIEKMREDKNKNENSTFETEEGEKCDKTPPEEPSSEE